MRPISSLRQSGSRYSASTPLGQYDVVAIIEAPSDEVMATASLSAAGQGHIRITTLKAFTEEEFYKMIEDLPDS